MPEKTAATKPPSPPRDARGVAHGILAAVLTKKQPLDEAWDAAAGLDGLERRDQAFCRLLLLTTLRQKGFLDHLLDNYLPQREKLPQAAQLALRLGAAQLLFLRTPAHAAISTSLDLLAREKKEIRGVVNAVLRRIATGPAPVTAPEENWRQAVPAWLQESWRAAYGADSAAAIAKSCLAEPPLDITPKSPGFTLPDAVRLPNGSLRLTDAGDITQLPGFAEGLWWVQDAASSLPARLLGDVKGKRVYDLCAAPGGKAAQLAAAGASVLALDRSKKRLARLKENMRRLGLAVDVAEGDAGNFTPAEKADAVLLDAPCSATGTIRRHPDLMHLKTAEDVARLAKSQRHLLAHAATLVKPGGLLVYAVCSLQPQEGPAVVADFLNAQGAGWRRVPVSAAEWGENGADFAALLTPEGDLRTWPCHWAALGGMDGFYAARLQRLT